MNRRKAILAALFIGAVLAAIWVGYEITHGSYRAILASIVALNGICVLLGRQTVIVEIDQEIDKQMAEKKESC